jgi:hypothetical protein
MCTFLLLINTLCRVWLHDIREQQRHVGHRCPSISQQCTFINNLNAGIEKKAISSALAQK